MKALSPITSNSRPRTTTNQLQKFSPEVTSSQLQESPQWITSHIAGPLHPNKQPVNFMCPRPWDNQSYPRPPTLLNKHVNPKATLNWQQFTSNTPAPSWQLVSPTPPSGELSEKCSKSHPTIICRRLLEDLWRNPLKIPHEHFGKYFWKKSRVILPIHEKNPLRKPTWEPR